MAVLSRVIGLSAIIASAFAAPAPVVEFSERSDLIARAQAVNYNQDYIAGGANVQYSPNQGAGSFSVNFNTNGDFVVGLGWNPGNSDPITFGGNYKTNSGVGLLSVYGWTTNPLVEYYIMEDPAGYSKAGTQKGTLTSDGSTYQIWQHQQTNQPSIQGTSTFQQYISIRSTPRTAGTVTVANHFNAWAAAGMKLGTQNFQVIAVESWSGSGSGTVTVAKGAAASSGGGGSSPAPTTTTTAASTPAPTSGGGGSTGGGSCSAIYGQCGGQGWTGPTCCSSGTCKYSNAWYSQCL